MKLIEFLARNNGDYDVYNDLMVGSLPAICGGYALSDFAKEKYQAALNLEVIEIRDNLIGIHCETDNDFKSLSRFLWDLAGYCDASHYEKCFIEKDDLSYIWRICSNVLGGWPISNDERRDLAEIIEKCKEITNLLNKGKSE